MPQFDRPYVALGEDFIDAFGTSTITPHAQAVAGTVTGRRVHRQLAA